jgi:uncharacterized protein with HEPN domain
LHDIVITIDSLTDITKNFTLDDYRNLGNKWMIERGLSIIGEAVYKANNLQRGLPITDIKRIIGTRHIIVHDYDKVDEGRMLIIVKRHLPTLKQEVEAILNDLENQNNTP